MPDFQQWLRRPLDGKFLIDSGLLYTINRDIMHPLGLAISVNNNNNIITIKDSRSQPENFVFSREIVINGYNKLRKFMVEFGDTQLEKRRNKLGWGTQPQEYK